MPDMQTDCFPNAIPEWPRGPISQLANVNPRYAGEKDRIYPFVEMASVGENFTGIRMIASRKLQGSGLTRFKVGDTLFAKIKPCPENGKVAFISELPDTIGLGSTEFTVLSPRGETNPRFLYHLVCSHPVRGLCVARMEGSTGRQRVPDDLFVNRLIVPIPLPWEQAAIARILDAVDTTIERTHEAVKRARDLEQSVLEKAFCNLVAEPRRLGKFIVDVRYGTSKASNEKGRGNAALRIPNVVGNRLALDDVAYVDLPSSEVERLQLGDGDLLLVRTNGNPSYVGRSVVFRRPDARIWVYASYLIRVRVRNRILPDYVNVFLGLERGRRELLRRVTTSAGNHNINSNSIRLIRIPVPVSRNAQEQIVELAKGFRLLIDSLETKARALSNLKRSLMHDLLTGKVRVGDVSKAFAS